MNTTRLSHLLPTLLSATLAGSRPSDSAERQRSPKLPAKDVDLRAFFREASVKAYPSASPLFHDLVADQSANRFRERPYNRYKNRKVPVGVPMKLGDIGLRQHLRQLDRVAEKARTRQEKKERAAKLAAM